MSKFRQYAKLLIIIALVVAVIKWLPREDISGAQVIDGDSLRLEGRDFRLSGIDAPEHGQTCKTATGKPYDCGRKARQFLRELVTGHTLKCRTINVDRYGRDVARCTTDGKDVGRQMLRAGWAIALPQFAPEYQRDERYARKRKRGIWQGRFMRPADWRALR